MSKRGENLVAMTVLGDMSRVYQIKCVLLERKGRHVGVNIRLNGRKEIVIYPSLTRREINFPAP
jgi:hypothetical protein